MWTLENWLRGDSDLFGVYSTRECLRMLPETHKSQLKNGWLEDDPASFWGKRPMFRGKFCCSFQGVFTYHWWYKQVFCWGRLMCDGGIQATSSPISTSFFPPHPPGRTCNHGNECRLQARFKMWFGSFFCKKTTLEFVVEGDVFLILFFSIFKSSLKSII